MKSKKNNNLSYEEVIDKLVYYFKYFENFFQLNKLDCIICRPDDLIGATIVNIANINKIFVTIQMPTRIFGYYWTFGAYSDHFFIEEFYSKNKNIKEKDIKNDSAYGSNATNRSKKIISQLNFRSLMKSIIFLSIDRIIFLYKDLKYKNKTTNRLTYGSLIRSKLFSYYRNIEYLTLCESNFKKIKDLDYIYFPLPDEVEYNTHSMARDFTNIYAIIIKLSSMLPLGYRLIVKEHLPNMGSKPSYFYKNILKRPNIIIIDYKVESLKLVQNAKAVATTVGTVSIEAAQFNKKSLVFANNVEYMHFKNVVNVKNITNLKFYLKNLLTPLNAKEKKILEKQVNAYRKFTITKGFFNPHTPIMQGGKNEKVIKEKKKDSVLIKKTASTLIEVFRFFYNRKESQ